MRFVTAQEIAFIDRFVQSVTINPFLHDLKRMKHMRQAMPIYAANEPPHVEGVEAVANEIDYGTLPIAA